MKRVIIESPYAGNVEENMLYLTACIHDSLQRGESPFASHGFFTQFLDDNVPDERALGIKAGLAWAEGADFVAVYDDKGISPGMRYAIERHENAGRTVVYRNII